jgi:hypothetical protein
LLFFFPETTFRTGHFKDLLDGGHQPLTIVVETGVADWEGISPNQRLEVIRQIVLPRHHGSIH